MKITKTQTETKSVIKNDLFDKKGFLTQLLKGFFGFKNDLRGTRFDI